MSGCEGGDVTFHLTVDTTKALHQIRMLETLLNRTLSLMRRFGLPEDVEKGIMEVQRLIAALNALRLTILAVQAASGPIGWAFAAVGAVGTAISFVDLGWENEMRGR